LSESLHTIEARLHALWTASLDGDTPSYERVLHLISGYLRSFFKKRLLSHPSDVEDLVQETLMAIHQKRHTYQSDQPLTAWMYAIARYKWVDHLRAHGRRGHLHDDIDDWANTLAVESEEDASDAHKDLDTLLAGLPARQREAIEHTRLHGLSISETAERTGQSESAVKVNIHRGLKTLIAKWGVRT
jgi:RNA polymerase sigma-70 factor (ECF subfamily)